MRKRTREQLETEVKYLNDQNTKLLIGMNDAMAQDFDHVTAWCKETNGEGKYRFHLLRATSPSGGLIITTFRFPGQRDYSTINYFDEMFTDHCFIERWQCAQSELCRLRDVYFDLNNPNKGEEVA